MFHRPSLAEEAYFKQLNAELNERRKIAAAFALARQPFGARATAEGEEQTTVPRDPPRD